MERPASHRHDLHDQFAPGVSNLWVVAETIKALNNTEKAIERTAREIWRTKASQPGTKQTSLWHCDSDSCCTRRGATLSQCCMHVGDAPSFDTDAKLVTNAQFNELEFDKKYRYPSTSARLLAWRSHPGPARSRSAYNHTWINLILCRKRVAIIAFFAIKRQMIPNWTM